MPLTLDALLQEALNLPSEQREILANLLLDSIDDQEEDISPEWKAEIDRRIAEIDAGTAVLIPAEEVFARLEEKYPSP